MLTKAHPFPGKLSSDQADEVRRLRQAGAPLAKLAEKFGVAKSSISAVVHLKVHEPPGTLRIAMPPSELDLLRELAEDSEIPVEQIAADVLLWALRSRAW